MLLVVLDCLSQVTDRLRISNLDRKDMSWVMAKSPTVELEYR
jgi:hypothetical protein